MSSKSAKEYGAKRGGDLLTIDPRKVVIEEDDPQHKHFAAHEPRRAIQPRILRLIRTKGAKALGETRVKMIKRSDGSSYVAARDGRVRIRHARIVLIEEIKKLLAGGDATKWTPEMGDPETWEPADGEALPLALRAVIETDDDATTILNAYQKRDPPLMLAQVCAEKRDNNVSVDEIGMLINRSKAQVENYLRFWDDGCDELKAALHDDSVTLNVALRLAEKSHDKQREALAKLAERGKKARGKAALRAVDGGDAVPAPRFRASAAKLAEEAAKMPEGPARAALEWALGRRDAPTVEQVSSETTSFTGGTTSAVTIDRDPDDVREIDELKSEIEKLRAAQKAATSGPIKVNGDNASDAIDESKARMKLRLVEDENATLRVEVEKLRMALKDPQLAIAIDLDTTETKDAKKLRSEIDSFKIDIEKIAEDVASDLASDEALDEHGKSIALMAARSALERATSQIVEKIEEVNGRVEDLNDKEEELKIREVEVVELENEAEKIVVDPATDEEMRAAQVDEVRFADRHGTLRALLGRKPGLRAVAESLGIDLADGRAASDAVYRILAERGVLAARPG